MVEDKADVFLVKGRNVDLRVPTGDRVPDCQQKRADDLDLTVNAQEILGPPERECDGLVGEAKELFLGTKIGFQPVDIPENRVVVVGAEDRQASRTTDTDPDELRDHRAVHHANSFTMAAEICAQNVLRYEVAVDCHRSASGIHAAEPTEGLFLNLPPDAHGN